MSDILQPISCLGVSTVDLRYTESNSSKPRMEFKVLDSQGHALAACQHCLLRQCAVER